MAIRRASSRLSRLAVAGDRAVLSATSLAFRKRRLDDIGFPIDAGGFSGACGNIVCNKDCNICCKALRQFWREVCG